MKRIPVTGKVYNDEDRKIMIECIESGEEITYGSWNVKFERLLNEYLGVYKSYFVNSGSSANLLALSAFTSPQMKKEWRLTSGDEVITVAAGFPTTIAPIIQNKAIPVFVDIELPTYNIDTEQMKTALSKKTKGVFIAHTLGNPFNLDEVISFCKENNLWLIEDNSDSLGSMYNDQKTGSFGDISTCSFYPAHHISTGQGGAVSTNDPSIARILLSMRNWGKDCICEPNHDNRCGERFSQAHGNLPIGYDHKYVFSNFGYNLQGTNILAALGYSQLKRVDQFTKQRHENFNTLYSILIEEKLPICLPESYRQSDPSWFAFPILLDYGIERRPIIDALSRKGIETRTLFAGNILRQPCFTDNPSIKYRQIGDLYNTDLVMNQMFFVGCWHGLNKDDMEYIGKTIKEIL